MRKIVPRCKHGGMTMIELLVAIAILAIMLGIAAPSMSRVIDDWRVTNATNAFTSSMRITRAEAIARTKPVTLCRVADETSTTCLSPKADDGYASGWIIFVKNGTSDDDKYLPGSGDELLLRQGRSKGLDHMRSTTDRHITFRPNGLLKSNPNTVAVVAKRASKSLCISNPGRVRHC